jgi:hypothetical protein
MSTVAKVLKIKTFYLLLLESNLRRVFCATFLTGVLFFLFQSEIRAGTSERAERREILAFILFGLTAER